MTEDEASKVWCPHVRIGEITNRGTQIIPGKTTREMACTCLGSKCAAWRWTLSQEEIDRIAQNGAPNTASVMVPSGYCGLAGKP